MKASIFLSALLLLFAAQVSARQNFQFSPAEPKPGDLITVEYKPAPVEGQEAGAVEAAFYGMGKDNAAVAEDLPLKKTGDSWTGSFVAPANMSFLYFGFKSGEKFDLNNNEGYYILLYDGGKPAEWAYSSLGRFYSGMGWRVGLENNLPKSIEAFEKQYELYPASKVETYAIYVSIKARNDKENEASIRQEGIENFLKAGIRNEREMSVLSNLYFAADLPEQGKMINNLLREKYPNGYWTAQELANSANREKDAAKKKQLIAQLVAKVESGDTLYQGFKANLNSYKGMMARYYISKKEWDQVDDAISQSGIDSKLDMAALYNSAAWQMQIDSANLPLAESFAKKATAYAEEVKNDASAVRPNYYTQKQWDDSREKTVAQYLDTYAMVLYKAGNYKKGLEMAKKGALDIYKGEDAGQNNTYALLAAKTISNRKLVPQLEKFVRTGKSKSDIIDILKDSYVKKYKSDKGFDLYLDELQRENYLKILAELKKDMLDEESPSFALYNLEGKKVDMKDLRGKVVVVDFWATWCGPCIASFPGMQRAQNKFKENPNVKFVFVDTWESAEDKKKNAADFITKNKYDFDVLLDTEDKVVEQFKVEGIPTKFVIDPTGKLRFKAVGFDGSDDKLVQELTAMIELASDAGKKAF
ncbi:MAG: redoxin domain-containing protein [Chitinophagaceae bacterium]